jgi:2-amino-4-hydroxy-6-hydroxymethyldihydropteridine diphosphokinase
MSNNLMNSEVWIGVGGNQGRPQQLVSDAILSLGDLHGVELLKQSSLYLTAPQDFVNQADFVNAVALISTSLTPMELLDELQMLEADYGRQRDKKRYGPRTIDLDVLLYADQIINTERLVVPHPRMHQRGFVLKPLAELNPELIIPGQGSVLELLSRCTEQRVSKL